MKEYRHAKAPRTYELHGVTHVELCTLNERGLAMIKRWRVALTRPCVAIALVVMGTIATTSLVAARVDTVGATTPTPAGPLYSWGYNQLGQLGDGTISGPETCPLSSNAFTGVADPCSATPVQVDLPPGVDATAVAGAGGEEAPDGCFDGSGFAIGSNGNLYAWGDNEYGQLGNGTTTNSATPVVASFPAGVTATSLAAGCDNTYAIGSDGNVYAWGNNTDGQLGDGTSSGPLLCQGDVACATTPERVSLPSNVTATAIAIGGDNVYAIGSNGDLYAWGDNIFGELGVGSDTGPDSCFDGRNPCSTNPVPVTLSVGVAPTAIAASQATGYAIGSDGNLYSWGSNVEGELGDGSTSGTGSPCGAFGPVCDLSPVRVVLPPDVAPTAISAGFEGAYAIGTDHKVYAWGWNVDGELGDGTRFGPQTCTFSQPCDSTPEPVQLPSGVKPVSIAGGRYDGYVLGTDGNVYAWGDNTGGELGNGDTVDSSSLTPVTVTFPNGSKPEALSAGPTTDSAYAIMAGPLCAAGLAAHVLTAAYHSGTFTGLFCVNAKGIGTYTQGTVSGWGSVTVRNGTTTIIAFGQKLALIGTMTDTRSGFVEFAPPPIKLGSFTLT